MKLLLMQYTKDETHINPASIEFMIAQNGQDEAEIHFRSGAVLTIGNDCFFRPAQPIGWHRRLCKGGRK